HLHAVPSAGRIARDAPRRGAQPQIIAERLRQALDQATHAAAEREERALVSRGFVAPKPLHHLLDASHALRKRARRPRGQARARRAQAEDYATVALLEVGKLGKRRAQAELA